MREPRLKRPLDALSAALGMGALAPLMGAIAVAIRLDSPGPVLYRARRAGRGGAPFTMYKFRTMHTRRDTHGPRITQHADRRVTRIGRLLRPARLDELPQLWNVLVGDMSLVGPRPEDPHYVELYPARFRPVLEARPGITSLAALLYRDEERLLVGEGWERMYVDEVMPAKLAIDLDYLRRQSLRLDAQILLATALSAVGLGRLVPLPHASGDIHAAEAPQPAPTNEATHRAAGAGQATGVDRGTEANRTTSGHRRTDADRPTSTPLDRGTHTSQPRAANDPPADLSPGGAEAAG